MRIRVALIALSVLSVNLFAITPGASAASVSSGLFLNLDAANYSSGLTWSDSSGAGNNGTLVNSPTLNSNTGKFIQFNGTSQYISFGNISTSFTSGFSATFFANFGTAQSYERVFDFGTGTGTANILAARSGTSNNFHFELYGSGNSLGTCLGTEMITNNQWAHYAVTIDGSYCKLYKNGQLFTSSAYSALPTAATRTSNFLARSNWSGDGYFDTGIGEISMYNRALGASEVLQNFKSEADICSTTTQSSSNTRFVKITAGNKCLWSVPNGVSSISYFIVGGGGGGGGANAGWLGGGGGGGGGEVKTSMLSVTPNAALVINIGTGGTAGAVNADGGGGSASWIDNYSTSVVAQGGSGGQGAPGTNSQAALSGDGGGSGASAYSGGVSDWDGGGGGGGAGGAGFNGIDIGNQGGTGGAGGVGVTNSAATNVATYFAAGGGGGGTPSNSNPPGTQVDGWGGIGGSNVGGNGGVVNSPRSPATAGVANTGSGGGGGGWNNSYTSTQRAGGAGADGVIYIKFTLAANTISSISVTSSSGGDSIYTNGETITVTVVWSDTVTVTGTPNIPIQGLTSKFLTYSSGNYSNTLRFTYTVTSPDLDSDGFVINANTLALNSGTILDSAGLSPTLDHSLISANLINAIDGRLIGSVTSITFSSSPAFRTTVTVTAGVSIAGKVLFKANNARIPNCLKRTTSGSSPITATCTWKPSKRGTNVVSATLSPTNGSYSVGTLSTSVFVLNRSGSR